MCCLLSLDWRGNGVGWEGVVEVSGKFNREVSGIYLSPRCVRAAVGCACVRESFFVRESENVQLPKLTQLERPH